MKILVSVILILVGITTYVALRDSDHLLQKQITRIDTAACHLPIKPDFCK